MFAFFKRRGFFVILGLVLAALLIWVFGPGFRFGRFDPLGSVTYRVMAIAAMFTWYGVWTLIKRARADRASNQLAAAVVKQSPGEGRPSADAVQLRERFDEAIAALKQKKRSGHSLYELPWYVIIGAPGSGKTTALVNSGLHFPLEQRTGKGALRGVGGTRNCDWWFTEEAVFLDTAGRYTTQDSDAGADSAGWAEFLALLKKYRKRRPVNGVILAISAHDLMVQGQAGREAHVAAARRRLNELNKELRIQLPVYVLVTKCDLVAGFSEYLDDVAQDGRTQVWGVTFPYEQTQQGTAAGAFPAEFDALMQRLNERVFARLEDERDVRRRARVFGFPQQMAAMRESLAEFVADAFESTRFDQRVLLRGIYFTSGTQEGTPIDRLLGALGRRFAVAAEAVAPPAGRGKAYFIERFLKDVLLAESGLAGVNRRVEMQKAAAQLGAYAAMALVAVLGVLVLWYSYGTNRAHLTDFTAYAASLDLPPAGGTVLDVLPRLDKVAGLVARARTFRTETSWAARGWGLDQGPWVEQAADDVYRNELSLALLGTMKTRIEARLRALLIDGKPDERYEYLRAYLMLEDSKNFESTQVKDVASREWERGFVTDPTSAGRLSDHFAKLLEYGLPGIQTDKDLVARVRESIPPDAVPSLIYSQVKLEFRKKNADAPQFEGLFAGRVFRSKDGRNIVLPNIFTKQGFDLVRPLVDEVDGRFDREQWVWGSARPGGMPSSATRRQLVWGEYEDEYIRTWETALQSIGLVSPTNLESAVSFLRAVAGSDAGNSALRQLLMTVDDQTFLVASMDKAKTVGFLSSAQNFLNESYRSAMAWYEGHKTEPGARITAHFSPIHALLTKTGDKAPIDALLDQIRALEAKLKTLGSSVGLDPTATGVAGLAMAATDLKRDATGMPGSAAGIGALVGEIGASAVSVSSGELNRGQRTKYQDVVQRCRQLIEGTYPFDPNGRRDVTLQDFGTMFKPGGVFESYLRTELADSATIAGSSITWKTLPTGASAALGPAERRQLEDALKIRDLFFAGGGSEPRVEFFVTFLRMDDKSRRFELELDGASPLRFANESPRPWDVTWPGAKPGPATATFEEFSGRRPYVSAEGQWAWFKLLSKGQLKQEADDRFLLTLQLEGSVTHFIEIQIRAKSVNNPFKNLGLLQSFSCGR